MKTNSRSRDGGDLERLTPSPPQLGYFTVNKKLIITDILSNNAFIALSISTLLKQSDSPAGSIAGMVLAASSKTPDEIEKLVAGGDMAVIGKHILTEQATILAALLNLTETPVDRMFLKIAATSQVSKLRSGDYDLADTADVEADGEAEAA